ncbi:LysM peptidoglycan-binding domain-containing protein [Streptomyces roseicoloratus]
MTDGTSESGRHAAPGETPADGAGEAEGATEGSAGAGGVGGTDKAGKPDEYTVKPGDSLSGIAQENGVTGGWAALYDANKNTVGSDPDLILPGQSLELELGELANQG